MSSPIAILGAGNMATALALTLARHHHPVRLYCIEPEVEEDINQRHHNTKYLDGCALPPHIVASADIQFVVEGADTVFIAVPSFAVADVMKHARPYLHPQAIIASISKGLDPNTLDPLIVKEADLLPSNFQDTLTTLGGPAIANEMAKGSPTAFVAASKNLRGAQRIKELLETEHVKVSTSTDLLGVGLAAALKNPYAIALGMCDGLKHPTNAKAFLLTLAIQEMSEILRAAGAKGDTAHGLAGLGDLIVTGFSPHGRNRTYGERLVGAASKTPQDLGLTTVEGIHASHLAQALSERLNIKAPLLHSITRCLEADTCFTQPFEQFLKEVTI